MLRALALLLGLLLLLASVQAGPLEDCYRNRDPDQGIKGCTQLIEQKIGDWASAYHNRSVFHRRKGEYEKAIDDADAAIRWGPKALYYHGRATTYLLVGETDKALADATQAIAMQPDSAGYYTTRGRIYARKGDSERALADFAAAIRLDPADPEPLQERGALHEAGGRADRAMADYRAALALPARGPTEREAHELARAGLGRLDGTAVAKAQPQTKPATPAPVAAAGPERRVALVIGNGNYLNAERLANPRNDAKAIAASLRRLGFAEVLERYDLGLAAMVEVLKGFGDMAAQADWAVVYYAGHGLEMGGITYLLPTDVKLARDTHVDDEALPLERVLSKVESARQLRLVILDSCRNNPFASRMARTVASRSVGRGLGPIEPAGGVLVAYAARHGTVALDGSGANSPFAEALLAYLEEPGLELQFLFRKVRDRVLTATQKAQEPFVYGSLSSETLYFKR